MADSHIVKEVDNHIASFRVGSFLVVPVMDLPMSLSRLEMAMGTRDS
jgi:hypothetical protein